MNAQSIPIDQLSLDEKVQLMDELWIKIHEQSANEKVPEWKLEYLRERLRVFQGGLEPSRDAREVVAELRRKYVEGPATSAR